MSRHLWETTVAVKAEIETSEREAVAPHVENVLRTVCYWALEEMKDKGDIDDYQNLRGEILSKVKEVKPCR